MPEEITSSPYLPPRDDRNAWAMHLFEHEKIDNHDAFITRMEEMGNRMNNGLNNFVPRILNAKGYDVEIAKSYMQIYLEITDIHADIAALLAQAPLTPPVSLAAKLHIASQMQNPTVRATHEEHWHALHAARELPVPALQDPNFALYKEMELSLVKGERELWMREICEQMEHTLLAGTHHTHIVGNQSLIENVQKDQQLREILFRMAKDLILHHRYTFVEIWS